MYENLVLEAIENTEPILFKDYGWVISFADIYTSCKDKGLDNKDIIEAIIKRLATDGHLEAVFNKIPGYEELLIGVKPLG